MVLTLRDLIEELQACEQRMSGDTRVFVKDKEWNLFTEVIGVSVNTPKVEKGEEPVVILEV